MDIEGFHRISDALRDHPGGVEVNPKPVGWLVYNARFIQIDFPQNVRFDEIMTALGKTGMLDGQVDNDSNRLGRLKAVIGLNSGILFEDLNWQPDSTEI
jgi:hypothetical protein